MAAFTALAGGNIAWISFHPGDNQPSAAAAARGFTQAPDAGYTQLLTANGYSVTRFLTQDNPPQSLIDQLNTFDLIIISRSVNSAHYQQSNETYAWNTAITKPVMILGGYVLRDNRLGYVTASTTPIDTTNDIRLLVEQPAHPIFNGIQLDQNNITVNPYATIVTAIIDGTNNVQRGISVSPDPLDGGGTILARIAPADAGPVGGTRMIIAEWPAGATLTPSDGGARNEILGGRRLVFLTGSRERDQVTSEVAGIFDLIGDGPQLLLNAVAYMIPEPNTAALLLLGGLPLLFLRRR
ncbi:PEP-CTERM sorting domain-containing protein [Limisphaera ngatamarikiensis]|uniref:PEP-CTERM sorting domain-containing protein n=1 Tax=Limisphaera ngatamarikiensis TaxID=1324935 RepID=A0A6M1RW75_9BACT|nr:PEP-CTERM sorting domain-containing protein [Limisphaera ngatamarikiensis]NGO39651.1 PEP-CTERM sorting domain-containing protein [Limisphaera ngatamarikiensis]